jgi:hypothetical protein
MLQIHMLRIHALPHVLFGNLFPPVGSKAKGMLFRDMLRRAASLERVDVVGAVVAPAASTANRQKSHDCQSDENDGGGCDHSLYAMANAPRVGYYLFAAEP